MGLSASSFLLLPVFSLLHVVLPPLPLVFLNTSVCFLSVSGPGALVSFELGCARINGDYSYVSLSGRENKKVGDVRQKGVCF